MAGLLDIDWLRERLGGSRIGQRIDWQVECESTNDVAWEALRQGAGDGLVVVSEYQLRGRGRLGRSWSMPRGAGLLFSIALEGIEQPSHAGGGRVDDGRASLSGGALCMLASVAACAGIQASTGVMVSIKWPNDLLINGRKVGGILIEGRELEPGRRVYVIGIGINCLQQRGHWEAELKSKATSLDLESSQPISREHVMAAIVESMNDWLSSMTNSRFEHMLEAWRLRCGDIGRPITLLHDGKTYSGTMLDVDPQAALVLQLDRGGVRSFDVADTSVYLDT
ncbi:MAG: biotin--[acetyl-CoA-carboxylase] ligase [Phycisphaerae bacterium]